MAATTILLKTKDKPVTDKFTAFIKSLSDEEKCSLLYFIEGANFARQLKLQSNKDTAKKTIQREDKQVIAKMD